MVYLCLNFDCDHPVDPISPLKEPLGQIVVCSTCGAPLSLFRDDTLSYEPLGQAQESVTFSESSYGNVTSVSTTSLYPSPAAAIGPPSDQNQDGYPLSASTYDSPIQHQLPIVKDMRRPWNFLEHGPTSATLGRPEAALLRSARLGITSSASTSKFTSFAGSLEQPGLLRDPVFEFYDHSAVKSDKVKPRSCIWCFLHNQKCIVGEGASCCQFCSGRSQYCKGPIKPVTDFTLQRGIPMVMRSADARRSLLDSIINDNPLFDVRITLELESHTFSSLVPTTISERYPLDLRSLRDDLHHSNGRPGWESLLDAIFTALENSEKNAGNSRVNNLNTFEGLCRRFAAALLLLGSLERGTLEVRTDEYQAGPYIMLETWRQLSIQASSTFLEVFIALNAYLGASRGKSAVIRRELPTLGSGFGLCHHALSHFGKELTDRVQFWPQLAGLCDVAPSLLEQLKVLGEAFDSASFQRYSSSVPPKLRGLHIAPHPVKGDGLHGTRQSTFVELLEQFFGSTLSDSAGDSRLAPKRDLHPHRDSTLPLSPSFRASPDGPPSIADGASQVHAIQPKEDWPLPILDKQARSRISQLLQEREEAQKQWKAKIAAIDEEIALLRAPLAPGFELSAGGHTGEPEVRAAPMPMTDMVLSSSIPRIPRPAATYEENKQNVPSLGKRKGAFWVWPNQKRVTRRLHDNDDVTMTDAMDDLPVPLVVEAIPALPASRLKQRLSQAFPARLSIVTGKPRTHHKATDCADALPESLPSNLASQRPSSWPRTRRWRKSLGVSVKSLRENFEKLALESKDSTLPRSSK